MVDGVTQLAFDFDEDEPVYTDCRPNTDGFLHVSGTDKDVEDACRKAGLMGKTKKGK